MCTTCLCLCAYVRERAKCSVCLLSFSRLMLCSRPPPVHLLVQVLCSRFFLMCTSCRYIHTLCELRYSCAFLPVLLSNIDYRFPDRRFAKLISEAEIIYRQTMCLPVACHCNVRTWAQNFWFFSFYSHLTNAIFTFGLFNIIFIWSPFLFSDFCCAHIWMEHHIVCVGNIICSFSII